MGADKSYLMALYRVGVAVSLILISIITNVLHRKKYKSYVL